MNRDLGYGIVFGFLGAGFVYSIAGLGGAIEASRIERECAALGKAIISKTTLQCKPTGTK